MMTYTKISYISKGRVYDQASFHRLLLLPLIHFLLLPHSQSKDSAFFNPKSKSINGLNKLCRIKSSAFKMMYTLKEKVSETLTYFFADSSNSSSPQTSPHSDEGKSISSYFSYILPSVSFNRSKPSKNGPDSGPIQSVSVSCNAENSEPQDDHIDAYVDFGPVGQIKDILKIKIKDEDQAPRRSSCSSETFEDASGRLTPTTPKTPLFNLTDDSFFISPELYEFLESSLPNIVKGCQWTLLYSTLKHGISLHTLVRKSAEFPGPCLLIVGDMQGAVFGGFLECSLTATSKKKYQGTNETFVFTTIYGEPRLFRPTGANRYYCLCSGESLAFGGGGNFALCLDEDLLTGTSGPCDTFGNLCLAHSSEFKLKNVELWGFTHASSYLMQR